MLKTKIAFFRVYLRSLALVYKNIKELENQGLWKRLNSFINENSLD